MIADWIAASMAQGLITASTADLNLLVGPTVIHDARSAASAGTQRITLETARDNRLSRHR